MGRGSAGPTRFVEGVALLFCLSGAAAAADLVVKAAELNEVVFSPQTARFVRLVLLDSQQGQPCLDELEVYGPEGGPNLALATAGSKAAASSLLPGYAIHQVAHLNDGRYGNSHSWIAAGTRHEWAQIELPQPQTVGKSVFSRDREGRSSNRLPSAIEVRVSLDGAKWNTVARTSDRVVLPEGPLTEADLLRYAFACEESNWRKVDTNEPVSRVLRQMDAMIERFASGGLDVSRERAQLSNLRQQEQELSQAGAASARPQELGHEARLAKRQLFLREPELAPLQHILFVKRQAYEPSHNYSDIFDPQGAPGGAVCLLDIPRQEGRLAPGRSRLTTLFDSRQGVARDPALSPDARTIWFGYRPTKQDYFHLWRMNADGSGARQVTDGPFHDYFPCPLPDGGLAFMTTRCKARFLCWRPQAFVLFRMEADGGQMQPLSFANVSEWTPSVMRDGRIMWMRSEYLDKWANFGHTLWAIQPDGSEPELLYLDPEMGSLAPMPFRPVEPSPTVSRTVRLRECSPASLGRQVRPLP
jgi:hypothetical protein